MAGDYRTCCTVESPSRLILFYPETTPSAVTTLLPTSPVCKLVGQQLILGRSSSADVRLNDDRMSRAYAAVWHDGKDPFVFRVSNFSERKLLTVDGVMLRHKEEAEVKDGSVLVLDFLEFKVKVCAGDVIACNYQVSFVKNVVLSPASSKPPGRQSLPLENTDRTANPLLACIRTGSLDSGMGFGRKGSVDMVGSGMINYPAADSFPTRSYSFSESNGVQYGLSETLRRSSVISGPSFVSKDNSEKTTLMTAPSLSEETKKLSLNIPVQPSSPPRLFMVPTSTTTPEQLKPNLCYNIPQESSSQTSTQSSPRKNVPCWFNISPDPRAMPQLQKVTSDVPDLSGMEQHIKNNLIIPNQKVCPSCHGCGEVQARPTVVEVGPEPGPGLGLGPHRQTLMLPDMMPGKGRGRRSPVENAEWNTDDPNINSYMG